MPASALPKRNSPQVQEMAMQDANFLSAYDVCLQYEESATQANQLHYVRILGFLLLNAPSRGIRSQVAKCIHSCEDETSLFDLGAFFEQYFIVPFRKYRGRTPKPSDHSSRPSFEAVRSQMKVDIKEAPKTHQDAKDRALIRDNWRCVVTGVVHEDAPDDIIAQLEPGAGGAYTECAHIIPEATFFGANPKIQENSKVQGRRFSHCSEQSTPDIQLDYSASILAVLKHFCYDIASFNGEKVHSLTNVITLEKNIHDMFDRLKLYFEATGEKNHYKVESYTRLPILNMRPLVTFSTNDPDHLPVPSSELLALHATCCKVAHLSGAAEHIDRVYRDAEEMGVLACDGTSGDILSYALLSMSNNAVDVRG